MENHRFKAAGLYTLEHHISKIKLRDHWKDERDNLQETIPKKKGPSENQKLVHLQNGCVRCTDPL